MQYINDFLRNNPKLLAIYVRVATTVVDKTLLPLNSIMRHVLLIQGINPNSEPGDLFKKQIYAAMAKVEDKEDFDSDFDTSWAHKQLMRTREKMSSLNLTKEVFKKLTSLDNLDDSNVEEKLHGVASKEVELRFFDETGNLKFDKLEEALHTIKEYAKDKELGEASSKKTVNKTKTSKKGTKVLSKKFKGVFRRTED